MKQNTDYAAQMKEMTKKLAAEEGFFDQDASDDEIKFTSLVESTNDLIDNEYENCYKNFPRFFIKNQETFELGQNSIKK